MTVRGARAESPEPVRAEVPFCMPSVPQKAVIM